MAHPHRVLVVSASPGQPSASLDELTALLDDGWRLVSASAMGATGGADGPATFAALVVLRRDDDKPVAGFR